MRGVLVDWLVDVGQELQLKDDTLFLAVDLLDRFLSAEVVLCRDFQLAGAACAWVAAKYEQELPPSSKRMAELTDDAYTVKEIVAMERRILKSLGYDLGRPTALHFLDLLLEVKTSSCSHMCSVQSALAGDSAFSAASCSASSSPGPCFVQPAVGYDESSDDEGDTAMYCGDDAATSQGRLYSAPLVHPRVRLLGKRPASPGSLSDLDDVCHPRKDQDRTATFEEMNVIHTPQRSEASFDDCVTPGCYRMDAEVAAQHTGRHWGAGAQPSAGAEAPAATPACCRHQLTETCLARFICEASLLQHDMSAHLPSQVAASSLLLARAILQGTHTAAWSAQLEALTGYTSADLAPCAIALAEAHRSCVTNTDLLALSFKHSAAGR